MLNIILGIGCELQLRMMNLNAVRADFTVCFDRQQDIFIGHDFHGKGAGGISHSLDHRLKYIVCCDDLSR